MLFRSAVVGWVAGKVINEMMEILTAADEWLGPKHPADRDPHTFLHIAAGRRAAGILAQTCMML